MRGRAASEDDSDDCMPPLDFVIKSRPVQQEPIQHSTRGRQPAQHMLMSPPFRCEDGSKSQAPSAPNGSAPPSRCQELSETGSDDDGHGKAFPVAGYPDCFSTD